jgi:hypothetical protein
MGQNTVCKRHPQYHLQGILGHDAQQGRCWGLIGIVEVFVQIYFTVIKQ